MAVYICVCVDDGVGNGVKRGRDKAGKGDKSVFASLCARFRSSSEKRGSKRNFVFENRVTCRAVISCRARPVVGCKG